MDQQTLLPVWVCSFNVKAWRHGKNDQPRQRALMLSGAVRATVGLSGLTVALEYPPPYDFDSQGAPQSPVIRQLPQVEQ